MKEFINNIRHKEGVDKEDWDRVKPKLIKILEYVYAWSEIEKVPLIITSIIRPKIEGISVSNSHLQGRAFDVSVKNWTETEIEQIVGLVNTEFKDIGAKSYSDGVSRAAVYEDGLPDKNGVPRGTFAHLHFQVRP